MNEKNATCTHACDTHTPELPYFSDLCNTFRQKGGKINNYEGGEAYDEWSKASNAKKVKLFRALERGDFFKQRLDWLISDFPEPEPTNYNGTARGGEMLASGEAKVANYKGRFGIFTLEDIALFNIPLSDYNMDYDDYLDAMSEINDDRQSDALAEAHEAWLTVLDAGGYTEEDLPFDEFLKRRY